MPVNMETFREAACTSDKSVHFRQNWRFWHQQRLAFL